MTARKAPAKKAAAKKAPTRRRGPGLPVDPPQLSPEERVSELEGKVATLEVTVGQLVSVIQQAIMAQMQQAVANNPEAQQALLAQFAAAAAQNQMNGMPQ